MGHSSKDRIDVKRWSALRTALHIGLTSRICVDGHESAKQYPYTRLHVEPHPWRRLETMSDFLSTERSHISSPSTQNYANLCKVSPSPRSSIRLRRRALTRAFA